MLGIKRKEIRFLNAIPMKQLSLLIYFWIFNAQLLKEVCIDIDWN